MFFCFTFFCFLFLGYLVAVVYDIPLGCGEANTGLFSSRWPMG
jgi:hypothetical protein